MYVRCNLPAVPHQKAPFNATPAPQQCGRAATRRAPFLLLNQGRYRPTATENHGLSQLNQRHRSQIITGYHCESKGTACRCQGTLCVTPLLHQDVAHLVRHTKAFLFAFVAPGAGCHSACLQLQLQPCLRPQFTTPLIPLSPLSAQSTTLHLFHSVITVPSVHHCPSIPLFSTVPSVHHSIHSTAAAVPSGAHHTSG